MKTDFRDDDTPTGAQKARVRNVYQHIAREYDDRIPGSTALDEQFATAEANFVFTRVRPDDEVLDIGCGTGRFTVPLAQRVAAVTAFDLSQAMLDRATEKARQAGVDLTTRCGDMADMPFHDGQFDVVVSMLALMHIPIADRQQVFTEIGRVLRPGGRLLIGVKNGIFERLGKVDRFATIDVTDVDNKELIFTGTADDDGQELHAPWHSFTPDELTRLACTAGMHPVSLRGNIPISAWLCDQILADKRIYDGLRAFEDSVADIPPFSHLGYHLLLEAVKPRYAT